VDPASPGGVAAGEGPVGGMKPDHIDPDFSWPEESWPQAIAATAVFVLVCIALYLWIITAGAAR